MPQEIERKFLLKNDDWKTLVESRVFCEQGYLCSDADRTVRVRRMGEKGFLTVKGRTQGLSRMEYEYEIPVADADAMLVLCAQTVSKWRNYVPLGDVIWEIDLFEGVNSGLVVAEVELTSEDQAICLPSWIGEEVSADGRYRNSALATHPFVEW